MSKFDQIQAIVVKELKDLQDSGYMLPENEDMEVGQAMGGASYNIAMRVYKAMTPQRYIRIDGKFYAVTAIKSTIKPEQDT
jgi:hypothetical protein